MEHRHNAGSTALTHTGLARGASPAPASPISVPDPDAGGEKAAGATAFIHFESKAFTDKLLRSMSIVEQALTKRLLPYIAFSSGKDSLVVTHLVHSYDPSINLLWSDDELELPETVAYMETLKSLAGDQLTITLGYAKHAGWFLPWRDNPPFRLPLAGSVHIGMQSDSWQARRGFGMVFTGLRSNENRKRRDWLLQHRPLYQVGNGRWRRWRCCPLEDWTEDDIWAAIAGWGLAYNPAYDVMSRMNIQRTMQRVGPLPLAPRYQLDLCWPDLLKRLEARYGARWQ